MSSTFCCTVSASWWLFHPFYAGHKQWWRYSRKWSGESRRAGFSGGSGKRPYNDETTLWQIVCWSQVCTASTWECYSNTPSWCQLAALPRGHLTKHAINSRSAEILSNNKRGSKDRTPSFLILSEWIKYLFLSLWPAAISSLRWVLECCTKGSCPHV